MDKEKKTYPKGKASLPLGLQFTIWSVLFWNSSLAHANILLVITNSHELNEQHRAIAVFERTFTKFTDRCFTIPTHIPGAKKNEGTEQTSNLGNIAQIMVQAMILSQVA